MGKQEVRITPNEDQKNKLTGENGGTEEKLGWWGRTKLKVKTFNEDHPRVKWIIGGVVAAGAAVAAWALAGGKKDDEETYEYEDDSEETDVSEDSEE